MVDWIALLQVAGPIALGLAGIGGTVWGVRYQSIRTEATAIAQTRRETFSALIGVAYQLQHKWAAECSGSLIVARHFTGTSRPDRAAVDALSDRAQHIAADCRFLGDQRLFTAARALGGAAQVVAANTGLAVTRTPETSREIAQALEEAVLEFETEAERILREHR